MVLNTSIPEYDHTDSRTLLATIEKRQSYGKGNLTSSIKKPRLKDSIVDDYRGQALIPKRHSMLPTSLNATLNKSIDTTNSLQKRLKFSSPEQKNLSVANLHGEDETPRNIESHLKSSAYRDSGMMSEAAAS